MNSFKVSLEQYSARHTYNTFSPDSVDYTIAKYPKIIKLEDISSFAKLVGEGCFHFCPATFKDGVKSRETFVQTQLIPIFFDKREASFEEVKAKADSYDLPILFAYDNEDFWDPNRFTVVFLNDVPFPELREADVTLKALTTIFPKADASSNDIINTYIGGEKLLYYDKTVPEINVDSVFMSMSLYLRKKYGATNYKRKIAEIAEITGIRLTDKGLLDVSIVDEVAEDNKNTTVLIDNKNSPISTLMENGNGELLLNRRYRINFNDLPSGEGRHDQKSSTIHRYFRSTDLKYLSSGCRLYQEFQSNGRILSQRELLGLASNLLQAETGDKKFKGILSEHSYYFKSQPERYDNWDYYFYYLKDKEPRTCVSYCPYHSECPHGRDIFSTVKPRYHQMERIANYEEHLVSTEKAWEDFKRNLQSAVDSNEKIWHIIKAQTAIGKTQAILEMLRHTGLNILIAVPTNKLKREICERAVEMGIEIIVSPSLHEVKDEMSEDVWEDINSLQESGKSVIPYLKKAIEDNSEYSDLFKQYLTELEEFNNYYGHAITTHRRFLTMDTSKYDLVIIDEDIIFNTIIPNKTDIALSDLKELSKWLKKHDAKSQLAAKVREILHNAEKMEEAFFTTKKIPFIKAYNAIPKEVDIGSLCKATDFYYRVDTDKDDSLSEESVSFMNPVKFDHNVKYIMVSATVDETICKHYFGAGNVKFYECLKARNEGTLNLYYDRSMSRSDMKSSPDVIGQIQKWSEFKYAISFKMFKDNMEKYYKNCLTYGSCAGRDHLKDKNIDVIGTPHQPDWIYKLFAYSLNLTFNSDEKIRNQKVEHNGFRFWFATFENQYLKDIQFYMVESELEQAVGRARLLRCGCIVNLYSNFPLSQANPMKSEYAKVAIA